ncbi:MAG: nucleotide exchange factor GrpE, partial [Kiloniellales bacterium]
MVRRKKKAPQAKPKGADAPPGEDAATEAVADQAAGQAEADDPVARLEAETASLKDQLLRALAETENLRRRTQREREDAVRYAAAPLIKDLIEVID